MVAGVANFMFVKIELSITRDCFSAGVTLSGENLFADWLVVNHRLLSRATLLITDCHQLP